MLAIIGVGCLHWYLSTRVPAYYTYKVEALLTYIGSPDNAPLEKVWVRFPVPTVNGEWQGSPTGKWSLYWVDENGLHLQASQEGGERELRPPRTSASIRGGADRESEYAPKGLFIADYLYPGEVLKGVIWTERVESKNATLAERGRTEALAVLTLENGDIPVGKFSVSVTLWGWKKDNLQLLENFYAEAENVEEIWLKRVGP
jgi:hypothetical protein